MKIMVATAGVQAASDNAEYVIKVANRIHANLIVSHVIRTGASDEAAELCFEIFRNAASELDKDLKIQFELRKGAVIEQLIEVAEEQAVDLILMGASNGQIVEQWISSDVKDQTAIPVLVIPYQMFN